MGGIVVHGGGTAAAGEPIEPGKEPAKGSEEVAARVAQEELAGGGKAAPTGAKKIEGKVSKGAAATGAAIAAIAAKALPIPTTPLAPPPMASIPPMLTPAAAAAGAAAAAPAGAAAGAPAAAAAPSGAAAGAPAAAAAPSGAAAGAIAAPAAWETKLVKPQYEIAIYEGIDIPLAELKEAITKFLLEAPGLGRIIKPPEFTKDDVLKIFVQEGVSADKLRDFLEMTYPEYASRVKYFFGIVANDYQEIPEWMRANRTNPDQQRPPAVMTELRGIDTNLPDLILDKILKDDSVKYIILSESHLEQSPMAFLQKYKREFAANGYELLGSEFYRYSLQPELDCIHFGLFSSKDFSPRAVGSYGAKRAPILSELDREGIRVVGLEDLESARLTTGLKMIATESGIQERTTTFDNAAANIIHRELHEREEGMPLSRNRHGKRKAILMVGSAHAEGVAARLGRANCAIIGPRDRERGTPATCELNQEVHGTYVDVVFNIPKETYVPPT